MPEDALFMGRYPARSRHHAGLLALLAERQEGKTTQLIDWLLDGETIDKWPSWSRVLIVPNPRQMEDIVSRFRAADQELRDKGCPGGLGKVILTAGGYALTRLRLADVEVAVDNAEMLIEQQLGLRPDLVSMTGSVFGPQPARVPFKDAKGVIHLWYAVEGVWGHLNRRVGPCENQECADFGRGGGGWPTEGSE
jgi:hypothetical protein